MKRRSLFKILAAALVLVLLLSLAGIVIRSKKNKKEQPPETKPQTTKVSIRLRRCLRGMSFLRMAKQVWSLLTGAFQTEKKLRAMMLHTASEKLRRLRFIPQALQI